MEDLSSYTSPDFLIKVTIFASIQVLVFLILTKSSAIFSAGEKNGGSHRSRPSRSTSIRSLLAGVSEVPAVGEAISSAGCSASSSACAAAVSGALFSYDFIEALID